MESGYFQSAGTLNLLRAFASGGYADLHEVHRWNLGFVERSPLAERYRDLAARIDETLAFMAACGMTSATTRDLRETDFYVSHEALLLPTSRRSRASISTSGEWYAVFRALPLDRRPHPPAGRRACRVPARRAQPDRDEGRADDGGRRSGADYRDAEPPNEPGRITLISRMGADKVGAKLPSLMRAVKRTGRKVVWLCDPMHGNTSPPLPSSRPAASTRSSTRCAASSTSMRPKARWAGGVHVEMTGQDVTECVGGAHRLTEDDLGARYETFCDPRLNAEQSLELAFLIAEELKARRRPNGRASAARHIRGAARAHDRLRGECDGSDLAADIAARTDSYFNRDKGGGRPLRRQARDVRGFPAPARDLGPAAHARMAGRRGGCTRHATSSSR